MNDIPVNEMLNGFSCVYFLWCRIELLAALGYSGDFRQKHLLDTEATYLSIFKDFEVNATEVLTVANGLWIQNSTSLIDEKFVDLVTTSYNADVFELKRNKDSTGEINEWVKKSTKGLIQKIAGE